MIRQNGYYWIKRDDTWKIAEWDYNSWWLAGIEYDLSGADFDEIDERPIERAD